MCVPSQISFLQIFITRITQSEGKRDISIHENMHTTHNASNHV